MELEDEADFFIAESGQFGVVQLIDFGAINAQLSAVGLVEGADDME